MGLGEEKEREKNNWGNVLCRQSSPDCLKFELDRAEAWACLRDY